MKKTTIIILIVAIALINLIGGFVIGYVYAKGRYSYQWCGQRYQAKEDLTDPGTTKLGGGRLLIEPPWTKSKDVITISNLPDGIRRDYHVMKYEIMFLINPCCHSVEEIEKKRSNITNRLNSFFSELDLFAYLQVRYYPCYLLQQINYRLGDMYFEDMYVKHLSVGSLGPAPE